MRLHHCNFHIVIRAHVILGCCGLLIAWTLITPANAQDDAKPPAQPWAGAALGDWANAAKATVITDLSRCEPESALSPMALRRHRWKTIPYQMTNGYKGTMIFVGPEADAPEVSLSLGVEGWHAVFVGLFAVVEAPTLAWIRLDDDPAAVPRYNKRIGSDRARNAYGNTEEVFFRAVRLKKDSRLRFRQQSTGDVSACGLTHVKLIPLADDEIKRIEAEERDPSHHVLAATNDGFSDLFYRSHRTASALLSQVEIFRGTDFGTLILQSPGADKVNYRSKIGATKGLHSEAYPRIGDRHFVESVRTLAEQNINPVEALTTRAHQIGMMVHVGLRPAGWSFFEPYADYWETPFYKDHPQWRCEDRDGTPVTRMSWAVPEVRKHLIDLLEELSQFGADGVNLVFTRGYPLVLYEVPARKLFQEKYGVDPREIPESDPRIAEFRGEVVTTFFRELRAVLDRDQKRRGVDRRMAISVLINGTAQDDFSYGVDLRKLMDEKLIDAVFTEFGFGATEKTVNLNFLGEVCRPAKIPFFPGIYNAPSSWSIIPNYYQHGAQGLTVWDAEVTDIYEWCWMSRFGHVDETAWRLQNLDLKNAPRAIYQFEKLGNQIRNGRFGPHWGG